MFRVLGVYNFGISHHECTVCICPRAAIILHLILLPPYQKPLWQKHCRPMLSDDAALAKFSQAQSFRACHSSCYTTCSSWSVPLLSHSSWLISLGPFLLVHSSCSIPLDPIHLIHSSWSILLNPFLFIHSSKALPPYDKIIAILCWATTLLWQSSLKHKVSGHVIHLATQVLIPQSFDMPCHAHHRTKSFCYFRSWRPPGGHSITTGEEDG